MKSAVSIAPTADAKRTVTYYLTLSIFEAYSLVAIIALSGYTYYQKIKTLE